jgi:hypothetical protein
MADGGKMFGNLPTAIPKNGSNEVERVDLTHSDMGARASHVPKLAKNPRNAVKHVTQPR